MMPTISTQEGSKKNESKTFHKRGATSRERMSDGFLEAYDRFSDEVFSYLYLRLQNREEAKKLLEEAFMLTWDSLLAGSNVQKVKAILDAMAERLVVESHSKKYLNFFSVEPASLVVLEA